MITYTSSPRSYPQSTGSPSFTRLINSSTTSGTLHKMFHCGNDKLTPTLVGIVFFSLFLLNLNWARKREKRHLVNEVIINLFFVCLVVWWKVVEKVYVFETFSCFYLNFYYLNSPSVLILLDCSQYYASLRLQHSSLHPFLRLHHCPFPYLFAGSSNLIILIVTHHWRL